MGMFDEVVLKENQECPSCGGAVPKEGFQTKDFACMMSTYVEGEATTGERFPLPGNISSARIYNNCSDCEILVEFQVRLENNTLYLDETIEPEVM